MRLVTWKIAAYLTSILIFALLVARQIGEAQISNDYYQLTEWRIFYPGHFIRRGLRGSLVEWLFQVTAIQPETLIRCFCTLASAVLASVFALYLFRWLWDKARSLIPILLLSPAGLFFYQNAILSIERFDVFFLLLTIGHLEICVCSKDEKSYLALSAALFSTLGVAAVLSHEAFLLLCLPINIVLSSWRLRRWDARMLLIYGLPTVVGCFCVFDHVSTADIVTLSHTLGVPIGSFQWYNGPIFLLMISPIQQVQIVGALFSADAVRPFLFTALFFGIIHFAVLRRAVCKSIVADAASKWTHPERVWRDLLWIPFACTLPMYVVAADYGRWFAMVIATFTICCARLLQVTKPIKKVPPFWNCIALVIFVFVPLPLNLKTPNTSPELLTWTGAAVLGHLLIKPAPRVQLRGKVDNATIDLGARREP